MESRHNFLIRAYNKAKYFCGAGVSPARKVAGETPAPQIIAGGTPAPQTLLPVCFLQTLGIGVTLLLPCLMGCGEKLATVAGTVRLDGKPVAAAGVALHPVGGGPIAGGSTDAEGRFRLEMSNKPGLPAGEYRVTVVKKETSGFMADKNGLSMGVAKGGVKEKWIVPKKYSSPTGSGLTASVKPGMEPLDLNLTSP